MKLHLCGAIFSFPFRTPAFGSSLLPDSARRNFSFPGWFCFNCLHFINLDQKKTLLVSEVKLQKAFCPLDGTLSSLELGKENVLATSLGCDRTLVTKQLKGGEDTLVQGWKGSGPSR